MTMLTLVSSVTGLKMQVRSEAIIALIPVDMIKAANEPHDSSTKTAVVLGPGLAYHVREKITTIAAMIEDRPELKAVDD